ncbi:hypothetical protein [Robinsoniella sp. KNHs210]|uniref:hypothetical protein n=1 Tax=Robinsoniella sp. KNHs210 TaxID=1469950 RepID=UPI0004857052|nr:hypothetical protein [Robinsoniella sp. KNHs210]
MIRIRQAWKNKLLIAASAMCMLAGGFYTGLGIYTVWNPSELPLVRDNTARERENDRKEEQNSLLADAMQYINIESVIYFQNPDDKGTIRLANDSRNRFCIKGTILSDRDGSVLYESDGIDPGFYIDSVYLNTKLEPGVYPCTVLIQFYQTEDDRYIGETARKAVVIIER